ncbi:MAG: hypothetical protein AAF609_01175 [Cyanobacteria bacterium P01_C01_bin.120]
MAKKKIEWSRQLRSLGLLLVSLVLLYGLGNLSLHSTAEEVDLPPAETVSIDYAAALTELQTSFTFRGEPINPRAVMALEPWLSDQLPGAIAVDVEGSTADTNQFYADVSVNEAGRVIAEWEQQGDRRFAGYLPLGQLSDGTYVLRTFINTGGSATFPSVMLVSCGLDSEMWRDGAPRSRLTLTRRGELFLEMGYSGDIAIVGQQITFTPAPRGDSPMTVEVAPL